MRKFLMTLLALVAVIMAKAQIETNGYWYNGWLTYNASPQAGGKVLMNAMAEGEEHEFIRGTTEYRVDKGRGVKVV